MKGSPQVPSIEQDRPFNINYWPKDTADIWSTIQNPLHSLEWRNSQSLEDTQVGYISQKYSLEIQKYHQRTDQKYDLQTYGVTWVSG